LASVAEPHHFYVAPYSALIDAAPDLAAPDTEQINSMSSSFQGTKF
jgi:hypothetical protein